MVCNLCIFNDKHYYKIGIFSLNSWLVQREFTVAEDPVRFIWSRSLLTWSMSTKVKNNITV